MTEKIEWYREVLELEPNSKVFFPLARLEDAEGNAASAISLLEKGLDRHPEFLEARLYLIELLHKNGERERCDAEVRKLGKMFASYAGFWQAWAACLASDASESDTASIIRFLAAHFVSGPVSFRDVINRGLDSLLKENAASPVAPQPAVQIAAPVQAAAAFAANSEAMLEDLDATLDEDVAPEPAPAAADLAAEQDPGILPAEEQPAEEMMAQAPAEPELAVADADPDAEMLPAEEQDPGMSPAEEEPAEEMMAEAPAEPELAVADADPDAEMLPAEEQDPGMSPAEEQPAEEMMAEAPAEPEPAVADADPDAEMLPAEEQDHGMSPAEEEPAEDMMAEAPAEPELADADHDTEMPVAEEPAAVDMAQSDTKAMAEVAESLGQIAQAGDVGDMVPPEEQETEAQADLAAAVEEMEAMAHPAQGKVAAVAKAEADMLASMELPEMAPADKADDDFGDEEPFSLRTRSMAEVLAEQGDIQGSLDIYQELAAAATSADEAEDINRRIATLRSRLNVANASASFQVDAEAAARSKEKLIGMLEALAERVEARAS